MPLAEQFATGPWHQKMLPLKAIIHVALGICAVLCVTIMKETTGYATGPLGPRFTQVLYPVGWDEYTGDATDNPYPRYFIFTSQQLVSDSALLLERYFSLQAVTLSPVQVPAAHTAGPAVIASKPYQGSTSTVNATWPQLQITLWDAPVPQQGAGLSPSAPLRTATVQLKRPQGALPAHLCNNTLDALLRIARPGDAGQGAATGYEASKPGIPTCEAAPDASTLQRFMGRLVRMTYTLPVDVHTSPAVTSPFALATCSKWHLVVTYGFEGRGHAEATSSQVLVGQCTSADVPPAHTASEPLQSCSHGVCTVVNESDITSFSDMRWGPFAVLVCTAALCFAHAVSTIKHLLLAWRIQRVAKKLPQPSDSTAANAWAALTLDDKLEVWRPWYFIALIGDVLLAAWVGYTLAQGVLGDLLSRDWSLLLALGAASIWLSMMEYLTFSRRTAGLSHTLARAAPRVARFLVGVAPVFVAFAAFGLALFGPGSARWSDMVMSFTTLFAFVNGDAYRESFTHTSHPQRPIWSFMGTLFLLLFALLFMYVVLNVVMAINEEAFFSTMQMGEADQNVSEVLQFLGSAKDETEYSLHKPPAGHRYLSPDLIAILNASDGHV